MKISLLPWKRKLQRAMSLSLHSCEHQHQECSTRRHPTTPLQVLDYAGVTGETLLVVEAFFVFIVITYLAFILTKKRRTVYYIRIREREIISYLPASNDLLPPPPPPSLPRPPQEASGLVGVGRCCLLSSAVCGVRLSRWLLAAGCRMSPAVGCPQNPEPRAASPAIST